MFHKGTVEYKCQVWYMHRCEPVRVPSQQATSTSLWAPPQLSIKVIWLVLQRVYQGQLLAEVLWWGWLLLCDGFTQRGWVMVNNSGSVVMALGKRCQNGATVKCQRISHITEFIRFVSQYRISKGCESSPSLSFSVLGFTAAFYQNRHSGCLIKDGI